MDGEHGLILMVRFRSSAECDWRMGRLGVRRRGASIYTRTILTAYLSGYKPAGNPQTASNVTHTKHFTAFAGFHRLAAGTLADIAPAVKKASKAAGNEPIVVFDNITGRSIDLDLRGTEQQIAARFASLSANPESTTHESPEPRGRGRPRLGVVAREVTLLPRHWEWLGTQPGGASVALRKLVEQARRAGGDRRRAARDAAYHFMSAMAGDLPGFEEAARALFADDRRRFDELIAAWPGDVRDHIVKIAFSARADSPEV
jgi:hypothetical protein